MQPQEDYQAKSASQHSRAVFACTIHTWCASAAVRLQRASCRSLKDGLEVAGHILLSGSRLRGGDDNQLALPPKKLLPQHVRTCTSAARPEVYGLQGAAKHQASIRCAHQRMLVLITNKLSLGQQPRLVWVTCHELGSMQKTRQTLPVVKWQRSLQSSQSTKTKAGHATKQDCG